VIYANEAGSLGLPSFVPMNKLTLITGDFIINGAAPPYALTVPHLLNISSLTQVYGTLSN
jgi:hypothetical protein